MRMIENIGQLYGQEEVNKGQQSHLVNVFREDVRI